MGTIYPKQFLTSLIILLSILISACQSAPATQAIPTLEPTAIPSATSTIEPTATTAPTASPVPSQTPTLEPTPTDPVAAMRYDLLGALDSVEWGLAGMSADTENQWRAFVEGKIELPQTETALVESFIAQWETLSPLLEEKPSPSSAEPAPRLREFEDTQGETQRPSSVAIYIIDEKATQEEGSERLFLVAHNKAGKAVGLTLSARIEGLEQQPSTDGRYVEYKEPDDEWIIRADARWLDPVSQRQDITKEFLDEMDAAPHYQQNSMYPRYYFNILNISSSFYGLENLTYNQMLLLKDTLSLYNQNNLAELASEVFASGDEVE